MVVTRNDIIVIPTKEGTITANLSKQNTTSQKLKPNTQEVGDPSFVGMTTPVIPTKEGSITANSSKQNTTSQKLNLSPHPLRNNNTAPLLLSVISFTKKMTKKGYVYMLTNSTRTVLYTGVTSNLKYRVWQHKNDIYIDSYTSKYGVKFLVYYEEWPSIQDAINREKEIKKWRREKKNWLVEKENKNWEELHLD